MAKRTVYAGHGQKTLTAETAPFGVRYLRVKSGNETVLVTLTPSEARELARVLTTEPTPETEITTY